MSTDAAPSPSLPSNNRRLIAKLLLVWLSANACLFAAPKVMAYVKQKRDEIRLNRLASCYELKHFPASSQASPPTQNPLPYAIYAPEESDLDSAVKSDLPLVVVLHGIGGRGNDGRSHLGAPGDFLVTTEAQTAHPSIVVAPQCPAGMSWPDISSQVYDLIISLLTEYPIDSNRIYLIGYSMGAYGCWHFAATAPHRFAGIIAVAGGGNPNDADRIGSTPIWAVHGTDDAVVPIEQSEQMVDAITIAGGNAKLTRLNDVGHKSFDILKETPKIYLQWLFSQENNRE